MNKKQGSAMVLAILLLSFFMALSLNMWYISQKKAQRAGDIVIGNRVLTDIDSSSTLGYYEFYLATEYMVNGFVTSPSSYTLLTTTTNATMNYTSGTAFTPTYEGISLENERQYFGAYLDTSGSALSTSSNAILKEEVIENHKLKSRNWATKADGITGSAITELWYDTNEKSVGGYKIISLKVKPIIASTYNTLDTTDINAFTTAINGVGSYNIKTIYEKTIHFPGTTKNESITYKVEVTRNSTINNTSSPYSIVEDSIENITVELQQ